MFSNWRSQPEGSGHSSSDETRVGDNDQDTQVMEPDQGNGKAILAILSILSILNLEPCQARLPVFAPRLLGRLSRAKLFS